MRKDGACANGRHPQKWLAPFSSRHESRPVHKSGWHLFHARPVKARFSLTRGTPNSPLSAAQTTGSPRERAKIRALTSTLQEIARFWRKRENHSSRSQITKVAGTFSRDPELAAHKSGWHLFAVAVAAHKSGWHLLRSASPRITPRAATSRSPLRPVASAAFRPNALPPNPSLVRLRRHSLLRNRDAHKRPLPTQLSRPFSRSDP